MPWRRLLYPQTERRIRQRENRIQEMRTHRPEQKNAARQLPIEQHRDDIHLQQLQDKVRVPMCKEKLPGTYCSASVFSGEITIIFIVLVR